MDRGALWATVLGVAELDMTEQLTHAVRSRPCDGAEPGKQLP